MKTTLSSLASVTLGLVLFCTSTHLSQAQVLLNQNFDSMGPTGTTLPAGWTAGYLGAVGTVNRAVMNPYAGNGLGITAMPIVVSDGSVVPSPNVGTVLNFGTTGAADRALGNYPRTNPSGDQIMQVEIVNNTGGFLNGIQLSYAGEQWRQAQGTAPAPEMLRVLLSTTSSTDGFLYLGGAFDFTAPKQAGANLGLDGNSAENRAVITGTYGFPTPLANGSSFFLRWHDWNDDGTTDHFLAIDDVSVSVATVIPEPGSLSLLLLALGAWSLRRR